MASIGSPEHSLSCCRGKTGLPKSAALFISLSWCGLQLFALLFPLLSPLPRDPSPHSPSPTSSPVIFSSAVICRLRTASVRWLLRPLGVFVTLLHPRTTSSFATSSSSTTPALWCSQNSSMMTFSR